MAGTLKVVKIDVRGEVCPAPLLAAAEAIKAAQPDECLELLTDYRPALLTVPAQALQMDWDVSIRRVGPSEWTILLTRSQMETE